MAFLNNLIKRLKAPVPKKVGQSPVKLNVMPAKAGPPMTPADRCKADSFRGRSLFGQSKQAADEQACLEKARQSAYFTFAKKARGISDKLNASPALKSMPKNLYETFSDDVLKIKKLKTRTFEL